MTFNPKQQEDYESESAIKFGLFFSLISILIITSPVYFNKVSGYDVWKNLLTGKYLFYFYNFPHYSTFTMAEVKDFVVTDNQDWLGSYLLFTVFKFSGYIGLSALKVLPILLIFLITGYLFKWRFYSVWIAITTLCSYGVAIRLQPRASYFGIICFSIFLFIWLRFYRTNNRIYLWCIPVIFVIWSNLHGSYLIGGFVYGALMLGFVLEINYYSRTEQGIHWSLFTVSSLTLLAVLVVRPFPDYLLLDRVFQFDQMLSTGSASTGVDVIRAGGMMKYLKYITHDLLAGSKSYTSPELYFSLRVFGGLTDYVAFIFALPLFLFYLLLMFFLDRDYPLSLGLGSFAAFWLGLGFQRALAYFSLAVFLMLMVDLVIEVGLIKNGQYALLNSKVIHSICLIGLTLFLIFLGYSILENRLAVNLGLYAKGSWHPGWGIDPYVRTKIPEYILRNHIERKIYNQLSLGSILAFELWPFKKVFWLLKTSVYTKEFKARNRKRNSGFRNIKKYNLKLGAVARVGAAHPEATSIFELIQGWEKIAEDQRIYLYCKCD